MARAVRFDEYGSVDVLRVEEVAEPAAGDGELVVRVVATSINPGEAKIREGLLDAMWPATFPSGQGSDFAGRIQAIGAGVHGWQVGDEVFGWVDTRSAHADFVTVPETQVTMKPPAVSFEAAGSLKVAGATAYAAVRAVGAQEGETVAVSAAAGGVGSIAVQLLRARGVRVLGIAGPANADWLRAKGVEPVAYGDGVGHRLRDAAPEGIDAFLDLHGDGYVELAVGLGIAPERIDTIADFEAAGKFGTQAVGGSDAASQAVLAELAEQVADGEVEVPIAATYPLEDVRAAYRELAEGHIRGKIVLITGA